MNRTDLLRKVDEIVDIARNAVANPAKRWSSGGGEVRFSDAAAFRAAGIALLDRTFGQTSNYAVQFRQQVNGQYFSDMEQGIGILRSARTDIEGGWLETAQGQVTGEVLGDFVALARAAMGAAGS